MKNKHASIRLVGISGSLRRLSYCTAILRTLRDELPDEVMLDIFELSRIPLYNEDRETDDFPSSVQTFKDAVTRCDGVVIVSPEYNHGMPGVFKNALDWASQPINKSPFAGKPTLVMTASPAFTGGVRAQVQIAETLRAMLANVISFPQVVVPAAHAKIVDGRLKDPASLDFAMKAIDALVVAIKQRRLISSSDD
ncbi:NADPH-dependent FMN reductase [Paraburkholderia sp. RL18-085-BIA-A]|uniref:NADPH-dependent FMN reductase n=1 Tax=Paraburkholderia sp. RL18-085-BIA-A TaxID=3031633 RepID=UPI0038BA4F4F